MCTYPQANLKQPASKKTVNKIKQKHTLSLCIHQLFFYILGTIIKITTINNKQITSTLIILHIFYTHLTHSESVIQPIFVEQEFAIYNFFFVTLRHESQHTHINIHITRLTYHI